MAKAKISPETMRILGKAKAAHPNLAEQAENLFRENLGSILQIPPETQPANKEPQNLSNVSKELDWRVAAIALIILAVGGGMALDFLSFEQIIELAKIVFE